MSSDIQFGDLEQAEPQRALRPDQDAHFATCPVGKIEDHELLIFVDLDVMRDMEAHAISNTRVELGGVMLGQQSIDDQGRPFVVISDSLRAEHYEATKGSFKFTHETWSQISRQRDEFRPDLEMVGWYHTHPGWSVFLSGMDLFICNNFFNRPLDVALVIDPCEQDRGWFQWNKEKTTQRTSGFVLTTGRFRQLELDQFARIYNKEPMMNMDPRYSGNPLTGSAQPSSVTLMDNRKSAFELAVLGMLMIQFLLFCVFAWKFLAPDQAASSAKDQTRIEELEKKLDSMNAMQDRTMRESAYNEVLSTLVAAQTGDTNMVEEFSNSKIQMQRMQANLEGQLALSNQLKHEKNQTLIELQKEIADSEKIAAQLVKTRGTLSDSKEKIDLLSKTLADAGVAEPDGTVGSITTPWWWLAIGTIAIGAIGSAIGYFIGRKDDPYAPLDERARDNNDRRDVEDTSGFGKKEMAFDDDPHADLVPKQRPTDKEKVAIKIDGEERKS